jgi:hypothetical protein
MGRTADTDMRRVEEAFTAILGRAAKVKAAGCEEWREGIRVYNASRMTPPFDAYVGFAVGPNEIMKEYFTVEPHLRNGDVPTDAGRPPNPARLSDQEAMRPAEEPLAAARNESAADASATSESASAASAR